MKKEVSLAKLRQIGSRLAEYLSSKKIGINELGRMTGTSGAQISFIIQGKKYGVDKFLAILEACPDLNPSWFMYGKGSMLKETGLSKEDEELQNQKNALLIEIERYKAQIENLTVLAGVKDLMIENLNSTIKIAQDSNKDLKEMLSLYKGLIDTDRSRSA